MEPSLIVSHPVGLDLLFERYPRATRNTIWAMSALPARAHSAWRLRRSSRPTACPSSEVVDKKVLKPVVQLVDKLVEARGAAADVGWSSTVRGWSAGAPHSCFRFFSRVLEADAHGVAGVVLGGIEGQSSRSMSEKGRWRGCGGNLRGGGSENMLCISEKCSGHPMRAPGGGANEVAGQGWGGRVGTQRVLRSSFARARLRIPAKRLDIECRVAWTQSL